MSDSAGTATAEVADAHEDGHHHPQHWHHFVTMDQQFDAAKMGMWIFLVTEILLFGGMFAAYAVFRSWAPEAFTAAHHHLDVVMGTVNTLVLLTSSLTVVLGIRRIQLGDQKGLIKYLLITIGLSAVFMVIKYFEYTHKIHLGLLPGSYYSYEGLQMAYVPIFFSLYFIMTAIHGIHVLLGMIAMGVLAVLASRGMFGEQYYTPVEMTGLYWHLVDMIWIFLYPLFYLIG